MPLSIHPLGELPALLKRPCRLAALDIGRKTIGLALSTPDWQQVTPLGTVTRTSKWHTDVAALEKALKGFEVQALIVGLPLNMDGSEGPQAQSVRQTIANLVAANPASLAHCVVAFADERLSTAGAEEILEERFSRQEAKHSGALDALAAQVILERALAAIAADRNHKPL